MNWKTFQISMLIAMAALAVHQPLANAFAKDDVNHVITVSPTGDYTTDARKAVDFLRYRSDQDTHWILKFEPGKYYLTLPLYSVGLNNLDILSDPSNPAQFIKAPDFKQEYLFYTRMSHDVKIRGFEFYGRTNFQESLNPVWTDQGVYFGSCNNVTVDNNKFYNFGNSALRVTTSEVDPVQGINSFNTTVTNNTFNNIYQISTTSNDKKHGATSEYRLEGNTFVNLRGSVKYASRTPGAKGLHLKNNLINGSNHFGFEIDNYNNVEIRDNTLTNIDSVAINIYTAGDQDRITKGFPWGDNYSIVGNNIHSVGRGIRYCHEAFFDGFQYVPHELAIANNTLYNVTDPAKYVPAIGLIRGKVDGLTLSDNKLSDIASKNYLAVIEGCTNVTSTGNTADGVTVAINNQYTPTESSSIGGSASTPPPSDSSGGGATTKPAAPSNLTSQYDGELAVLLNWKDNASNESSEELWGSTDGKTYSLIAKLYANTTRFTHKIRRVPAAANFYYVVKAVNSIGASGFSNASMVSWHQTASSSGQ